MPVPCIMEVYATALINSTSNALCPLIFLQLAGDDDVDWTLKNADGTSVDDGLKIRSLGKGPDGSYQALIWAVSDTSVKAGGYVVTATDTLGNTRTGIVVVEKSCEGAGGTCPVGQNPPLASAEAGLGSVSTRVSMGRYGFGKAIGALSIHEKYPTNLLSQPACLGFLYPHGTNNPQCEVITNSLGIRQVKAAEAFANIATNTLYKYSIEIFSPSAASTNKDADGLYTLTGSPLATIVVENPDATGATTNKLRITDGEGVVSNYEWKTNGWELVQGGGLRSQIKSTEFTNDLRITTVRTINSEGALVACHIRKYQNYSFGEFLTEEARGAGSECLTNSFEYYTDTNLFTKGFLKQSVYGDGRWEIHSYETNGYRTNLYTGFLNEALTTNLAVIRSIQTRYGSNAAPGAADSGRRRPSDPRCTVEYVQGHEISRSYKLYFPFEKREIRAVNPGAGWDDSSNLVTIVKYYSDLANTNRLKSVERPDGTMTLYQYHFFTNSSGDAFRTNTVLTGAPNSAKSDITNGVKAITVLGHFGQTISHTSIDISSGITNAVELYSDYDQFNRPKKITYIDGTFSWTDHACCGPETVTNREGTVITYLRDPMKRKVGVKQNGITVTNVLDAEGKVLRMIRIGTTGQSITQSAYKYDLLGKQVALTNSLGQVTTYSEGITNGQLTRVTINPDGSTRVETYYRDGQLAKVTGTAVHPARYEHGTEQDGGVWRLYSKEIKLDGNGNDTSEWSKTYTDMLGRNYKTTHSDGSTRQSFYNIKGQLVKQVDPDGVTTLYAYNARGEQSIVALDANRDSVINTNGTDRLQETARWFTTNGTLKLQRAATYAWFTNNSGGTSNVVSVSDVTVDGLLSWNSQAGVTNRTGIRYTGSGNRYVTNTAPDGSYTLSHFLHGLLQSVVRKDSGGAQLSQVSYYYDAHGRQYAATDARNGTTYYTYNDADRVVATITPPPGSGAGPQTTLYEHDWAGRLIRTVLPDGTSVTNEYHPGGELKKTYGSRNYPVQYGYDAQGRRTNMITWKNFAADSGKATTVWKYDAYRGFMTNKVYDDGKGPSYAYTPAGRLRSRTWARGVTTDYHTNALGETFATTYSDGTPAVTNYFDRLGRITNVVDGAGSRFLRYGENGQVLSETNSAGALIGANLRLAYDHLNRRTNYQVYATNTALLGHSFTFDSASRITNVSDGVYQAGYSYLSNSPMISQITYRSNTTTRMTTTRTHDFLNRLTSISSQPSASGAGAIAFNYTYNNANQRTRVNLDDGSFWIYEYDSLGQLISGKRYWSDWTPVAGQQYEYAFDDIGNRTSTKAGGDAGGSGLRSASYTANALNQYSSRDVPGYLNILGAAHANASVTVNEATAYRKGEYFWKELSADNSAGAVWQSITNIASLTGTNQTNTGNLFLPKTAETYTYDLDGNLTSDGRWTNRWDGENRLIEMTSHAGGPSGSRKALQFAYDSQSRRFSKIVSNWTGSAWVRVLHETFVYDGWNLLAALNGTNGAILKSFLWGLDLSGSLEGAGGVGGLLFFTEHPTSPSSTHAAVYDGNGNVMGLVNSAGNVSARYEYDPFGQTIRASGAAATLNPVRFSSKYVDVETDLAAYTYRFLNLSAGRWLNRDPIGTIGGRNLFAYCLNSPPNFLDPVGMSPASDLSAKLRDEIYKVEADPSFLVMTTHYPPHLRRLEAIIELIKVIDGSAGNEIDGLYDAEKNTLTARIQTIGIDTIVHELTHAYNDIRLGFDPIWDDKRDEGIAHVVEKFSNISDRLLTMGRVLLRKDCDHKAIADQWTLLWRNWGVFPGTWHDYNWQNPLGGNEPIRSKQIADTASALGVRLSCQEVKRRANLWLEEAGCCFRLICRPGERISERDIAPRELDRAFE